MARWQIREQDGFTWRLRPGTAPALVDRMLDLRKGTLPNAGIVKQNPVRTVFKVEAEGEQLYAKWHRFRGIWDAILSRFRGTRAEREWKMALALERLGIPSVTPILLGRQTRFGLPLESFLATRAVEGTCLKELARGLIGARDHKLAARRRALVRKLGALARSLHAGGVCHPDLHSDNVLVTEPDDGLCLLDLHSATMRAGISRRRRVQNLSVLCRSLTKPGATAQDSLRFMKAYLGPESAQDKLRDLAEAIRAKSRRLKARGIRSRSRRCVVRSSVFTNERTPLGCVYRRRTFSIEQVSHAVELHERVMAGAPGGEMLKRSPKTNVTLLKWREGAPDIAQLCVKEFVRGGVLRLLPSRLRHRPAMVSWKASLGLAVRGVGGAEALAVVIGKGNRSYLIMRAVQSAEPLAEYVHRALTPRVDVSRRRAFVRVAGDFLARCYSAGVSHQDLKASNVLVREKGDAGWDFVLLDLAAVRFPRRVGREQKLLNLAQLNASTPIQFSWADRLRLLRRLAGDDPTLAGRQTASEIARITRGRSCVWSR